MFLLSRLQNNLNAKHEYHLNAKLSKEGDTYRDLIGLTRDIKIIKNKTLIKFNS
jgi:hypothetical protein